MGGDSFGTVDFLAMRLRTSRDEMLESFFFELKLANRVVQRHPSCSNISHYKVILDHHPYVIKII